MSLRLVRSAAAHRRLASARRWLAARVPGEEVLVVASSADSANELLRELALERGAAFGWHRATLPRLAAALAAPTLAREGRVPVGRLGAQALVARVLHRQGENAALGRFEPVADGPGLSRAIWQALHELRHAGVDASALDKEEPALRILLEDYEAELDRAGLADRARVFTWAAVDARAGGHPLIGLPTLLLDVPVETAVERELVCALAGRAPELLASLPAGDATTEANLRAALGVDPEDDGGGEAAGETSLDRLRTHLFEDTAPGESPQGEDVVVLSAPGESRECVEIARRVQRLADDGVPFDRIAILLRSPDEYRPHLEEALGRAGVPAHFARGALRPDPEGRAFLALLACAAEGLSARRFAEYLSLGAVPDATPDGGPPAAEAPAERWVAPDEELVPEAVAEALEAAARSDAGPPAERELAVAGEAPARAGTLRVPRRWERLLVDAAVIGGRERWERRLEGLARSLALDLDDQEDPEAPAAERLRRSLSDLENLRGYALPLLDDLAALPGSADWGAWLERLSALASRALRRPDRVLSVLAELAPMAAVGPVDLDEVRLVLSRRLLQVSEPPPTGRYGRVYVAPADAARGLCFDAVFVPGLAERLFPRKIQEEPILLDAARVRLGGDLETNRQRLLRERLALRIAVGAARRRIVLSYPRLDLDQSRPRVPSFYALEALRAATGRLPGFDDLARDAERVATARVGWPAPARAEDAIDEAEHDLALLDTLLSQDPEHSVGTARYLLGANPHLGRALRFRARRWIPGWTQADGLVPPARGEIGAAAREAIALHGLRARSFSPTALQQFASCPYRFFLYAVHRLAPREVPEAIEEMDPLQRGSLVHDVQFELYQRLRDEGGLPVRPGNLAEARARLDEVLDATARRYRDDLAPAIDRVWTDGVESVRADLREWLRRTSDDDSGFDPWRFELSFGLAARRERDPDSRDEPVDTGHGLTLRGSIDLVERSGDGRIRVTDHKTGKERFPKGGVVDGGRALQPVLYALAAEKLFPDARVESGRLYYCTAAGGFAERSVPLDARARKSASTVAEVIGAALAEPFLPAAPAEGACRWCDYRVVCGPYEEMRARRKWQPRLAPLERLRALP
jgi:CRISPR/Cas system-associated exonuclease Cas4 (RecB family)